MHSARVLWFGSTRAFAPRRLAAEGFAVEVVKSLPESVEADVCVVASADLLRAAAVAAAAPRMKVIALVPEPRDVASVLAAGAHDAVSAASAEVELPARVRAWVRVAQSERQVVAGHEALVARARRLEAVLAESERTRAGLAALADTDELTGLGNRRSLLGRLTVAVDYSARYGGALSVAIVELDGLGLLLERSGRAAADATLVRVAEIVQAAVRSVDHAARIGEDRFGVVLPATPATSAVAVAERIRDLVAALLPVDGVRLAASVGIAGAMPGMIPDALLARAEAALEAARRGGKNRVERAA